MPRRPPVVCQNSAERNPKRIRELIWPPKPLRSAEFSSRTPVLVRLARLSRLSLEIASSPVIALLIETNSLFLITGNLPLWQRKGWRILDQIAPGEPGIGEFPRIFPVDQGNDSRDEFPPDSPHRH